MLENDSFFVVGIGASAGGLEPLKTFIKKIESSDNFTYVICQHLSSNQPTKLLEIFSRIASIPVSMIKNNESIEANRIYICPPKYDLTVENDRFKLLAPIQKNYYIPSINQFFNSLAKEKEDKSIGIILSGAGNDGAEGIEAIKNIGGITIAQKPVTAEHSEMPKSAINTKHIDLVLEPDEIASELLTILKYPLVLHKEENYTEQLNTIYEILFDKTDTDFSDYKTSTIQRRIKRRMIVNRKKTLNEYIKFLKSSDEEVILLHKELLVIVTSFFRDKEAFEHLEMTIKESLQKQDESKQLFRVWSVGCATGEEAYSIAIILYKLLKKRKLNYKIQIFATDMSSEAIKFARNGEFSVLDVENIAPEIIDEYFEKKGEVYKVSKDIRDLIIFSKHDIVKDPPFLNMDLITCRNLLIYFNSTLQKRIFSIFFNILNKDGVLFLGKSESTSNLTNLFSTLDNKSKIFKKDLSATPPPYGLMTYNHKRFVPNITTFKKDNKKKDKKDMHFQSFLAQTILDRYIDSYIVINRENNIIYTKGNLNDYMKLPNGGFTQELFAFLKDNVRVDIRTATLRARKQKDIVNITLKLSKKKSLQIDVVPIVENETITDSLCIIFKESEDLSEEFFDSNKELFNKYNKLNIQELEKELIETKEKLQTTIEELETSNEELQSTNEEFQSSNEELQSTNEELETSNEELQSTNEELTTVNQELELKSEELEKAKAELENINNNQEQIIYKNTIEIKKINEDLKERNRALKETLTLLESTFEQAAVGIAQVSLDGRWLKVNKKLTDIVGYTKDELLELRFQDITHPEDLTKDLTKMSCLLRGDIKTYSMNKRYHKKDGAYVWVNLTVSLVRKEQANEPDFFIAVIEDISLQKEYEEKLKSQKEEFETIFKFSHDSIAVVDLDTNFLKVNNAFIELTGFSKEYLLTKSCNDLTTPEDKHKNSLVIKETINTGHTENIEKNCVVSDERIITVNMSASLLPGKDKILLSLKDISSLKIMEQQSKLASMGEMIGNIAHQWRQPLSVITTNISGLKLKSDLSGIDTNDIDECERNIIKQANYLSNTIDNFRNFLKGERFITKVSIKSVIENAISLVNASLSNNYVNLVLDIEDDIRINGNLNELTEALINIINNSKDVLKSNITEESDRIIIISTKIQHNETIELKIKDSGGGIKNSIIDKIFEPYFTTKHQSQGTGLGLSITHKIITLRHHGKISVDNEEFEFNDKKYIGACFKIVFRSDLNQI